MESLEIPSQIGHTPSDGTQLSTQNPKLFLQAPLPVPDSSNPATLELEKRLSRWRNIIKAPASRPTSAIDNLLKSRADWNRLQHTIAAHSAEKNARNSKANPKSTALPHLLIPGSHHLLPEKGSAEKGLLENSLPWQTEWWTLFHPLSSSLVPEDSTWNYSGSSLLEISASNAKAELLMSDHRGKDSDTRGRKKLLHAVARKVLAYPLPDRFCKAALPYKEKAGGDGRITDAVKRHPRSINLIPGNGLNEDSRSASSAARSAMMMSHLHHPYIVKSAHIDDRGNGFSGSGKLPSLFGESDNFSSPFGVAQYPAMRKEPPKKSKTLYADRNSFLPNAARNARLGQQHILAEGKDMPSDRKYRNPVLSTDGRGDEARGGEIFMDYQQHLPTTWEGEDARRKRKKKGSF